MRLPRQAQANFQLAATMEIGTGFELDAPGASMRTIRQTEATCNQLRWQAGRSGRVRISRGYGDVVKVEAVE